MTSTETTENQGFRLLSAKELAKVLSVSKRQVFRLNSCGKMPAAVRIGGSVRWVNSTIQRWIEMGCPDQKTFEEMREVQNG